MCCFVWCRIVEGIIDFDLPFCSECGLGSPGEVPAEFLKIACLFEEEIVLFILFSAVGSA